MRAETVVRAEAVRRVPDGVDDLLAAAFGVAHRTLPGVSSVSPIESAAPVVEGLAAWPRSSRLRPPSAGVCAMAAAWTSQWLWHPERKRRL